MTQKKLSRFNSSTDTADLLQTPALYSFVLRTIQIARTASHLLATGVQPDQAFKEAVEPVLARLAKLDEDGLPVDAEVESVRQHAEYLTRHYRL